MAEGVQAQKRDRFPAAVGDRVPLLNGREAGPEAPVERELQRLPAGAHPEPQFLGPVTAASYALAEEIILRASGEREPVAGRGGPLRGGRAPGPQGGRMLE